MLLGFDVYKYDYIPLSSNDRIIASEAIDRGLSPCEGTKIIIDILLKIDYNPKNGDNND